MRRMTIWMLLAGAVLLAPAHRDNAAPAQENAPRADEPVKVHDDARRYTLELPPGWKTYEPDELTAMNAEFRERPGGSAVHYERAFRPQANPRDSYPYVLVHVQDIPLAGATYERISHDFKAEPAAGQLVENVKPGQLFLDQEQNRLLIRTEIDVPMVGRVQVLTVGHLGERGIVYLHAYSREAELPQYLAAFNAMNGSFRYDPGAEFKPGPGTWVMIRNGSIFGALAGGAIGALVALWTWLNRRKGAARQG